MVETHDNDQVVLTLVCEEKQSNQTKTTKEDLMTKKTKKCQKLDPIVIDEDDELIFKEKSDFDSEDYCPVTFIIFNPFLTFRLSMYFLFITLKTFLFILRCFRFMQMKLFLVTCFSIFSRFKPRSWFSLVPNWWINEHQVNKRRSVVKYLRNYHIQTRKGRRRW
jgi:hypothetical protein